MRDIVNLPDDGHLYAAHVMHDLWRESRDATTAGNTIIVTDVGQHQMWEAQYFRHESRRTSSPPAASAPWASPCPPPSAQKFACPDKDVWCIAGDGGFQMTAAELSTIAQENIKVHIAVINNGYLGMVRQWQEAFYEKNYACSPILSPDFVKLAAAHGIAGATVTRRADVIPAVREARAAKRPFLIDFRVEQEDSVYPMIAPGAALDEMIRRPHNPLIETAEDK